MSDGPEIQREAIEHRVRFACGALLERISEIIIAAMRDAKEASALIQAIHADPKIQEVLNGGIFDDEEA